MGVIAQMAKRRYASGGALSGLPNSTSPLTSGSGSRTYNPITNQADYYTYGEGPEHQFFTGRTGTSPISAGSGFTNEGNNVHIPEQGGTNWGDLITEIPQLGKTVALAGDVLKGAGLDNSVTQGMIDYGNKAANPIKTVADWYKGLGSGSGSSAIGGTGAAAGEGALAGLGSIGTGAMFGTSGAGALGASGATAGLGDLGTATAGQLFGTSGSAAAGAGAGSLGGAGLTGAGEGALGSTGLAGSGAAAEGAAGAGAAGTGVGSTIASYAGPAMAAYAAYFLANGLLSDYKGIGLSPEEQLQLSTGNYAGNNGYIHLGGDNYLLPNGGVVDFNTIQNLAMLDPRGAKGATTVKSAGDQSKYDQLYNSLANSGNAGYYKQVQDLGTRSLGWTPEQVQQGYADLANYKPGINGAGDSMTPEERIAAAQAAGYYAQGGRPTHGHLGNMLVEHFKSGRGSQYVSGPGTGRSDDIDAKLSNGEYVMDAETVAMLGDGSSDAGARRLDQLRENLRKHKGQALAKGKFSPNAKAPEQYMRGGK